MALRPNPDIPADAKPFHAATLGEALALAAQAFSVSPAEIEFGYDRAFFATGASGVQVLAWTQPFPEELREARNYVREVLRQLNDDSPIGALQETDEEGRTRWILTVDSGQGGGIGSAAEGALKRLVNECSGWDVKLRFDGAPDEREQRLEHDVRSLADRVLRSGRPQRMRPMNSYDRRIVHNIVREIHGLATRSVGEGRNRQVEIIPAEG